MASELTTSTPSTDLLTVRVTRGNDVSRVQLIGELDLSSAGVLNASLDQLDGDVVVDLAWLGFLDSSGIQTLNAHRRRLEDSGGSFTMRRANNQVRQVLTIVGLEGWLDD